MRSFETVLRMLRGQQRLKNRDLPREGFPLARRFLQGRRRRKFCLGRVREEGHHSAFLDSRGGSSGRPSQICLHAPPWFPCPGWPDLRDLCELLRQWRKKNEWIIKWTINNKRQFWLQVTMIYQSAHQFIHISCNPWLIISFSCFTHQI